MLTSTLVAKYGITNADWDRVSAIDSLFSGSQNDPELEAFFDAQCVTNSQPFDISFAITQGGHVVTQIIVFKTEKHKDLYLADGITLFDDKEI